MTLTTEQREEWTWFQAQVAAAHPRARVVPDSEGWPIVPGSLGRVETALDRTLLAVFTTRRVVGKLLAIPGMQRHQMGDAEVRLRFPANAPTCLQAVLAVIRPRIRKAMTAEQLAALARAGEGTRKTRSTGSTADGARERPTSA